jgi:peroxin-5
MAFQSMMTGAECAVAVNPLHQVLKHSDRDQSLQKVRGQRSVLGSA